MKCTKCGQEVKKEKNVLPVRKAVAILRKDKRRLRKETMTRASIKRTFGLKDDQVDEIPSVKVYDEQRYYKKDVVDFLESGGYKRQSRLSV